MHRLCAVALVGILLAGCGPSGPKLAKVVGKVTYKSAPLKFGSVIFQPEAGKAASGIIKPDGTFELFTNKPGDGALIGKHRVRVMSTTTQDPSFSVKEGQEMPLGKSLIPEKYGDLDKTPLKDIQVEDKSENTFTFNLVD